MIQSFKGSATAEVWRTGKSKKFDPRIVKSALRKLQMIHYAESLSDLQVPPGNRLEQLEGDRRGEHSVRIKQQWRICFTWTHRGAEDVEICDDH